MERKREFNVRGLTQEHKDFLYKYAQEHLGSRSRNKAILHLINEKMPKSDQSKLNSPPIKNGKETKKRVQISLRESDYNLIEEIAKEEDTSMQYYIISLILKDLYNHERLNGKQLELLRKSNYQLYKIGVNVNQIAKAMNQGEERTLDVEKLDLYINEHIEQVKTLLKNSLEKY